MMTVKEVAALAGVSVRTLQFYDEIDLFKPTETTRAGYRLYDESSLAQLQQILFFKELDFSLKQIKSIMEHPQFDQNEVLKKQRDLLQMKRDRLNGLLNLIDRRMKGEAEMEFKEFDLGAYFDALEAFKHTHTNEILTQLGSMESFDEIVSQLRDREDELAQAVVEQYGSVERFTNAMKGNLKDFLTNGPSFTRKETEDFTAKTKELTRRLTMDRTRDPGSQEVQRLVGELVAFVDECNQGMDMGENYWSVLAQSYLSNPAFLQATDKEYGAGASCYIGKAINAYLERQ